MLQPEYKNLSCFQVRFIPSLIQTNLSLLCFRNWPHSLSTLSASSLNARKRTQRSLSRFSFGKEQRKHSRWSMATAHTLKGTFYQTMQLLHLKFVFVRSKGPKVTWSEEEQMELRRLFDEFSQRQETGRLKYFSRFCI
jgi:hypothetical protein